jgi:hypothetical protein
MAPVAVSLRLTGILHPAGSALRIPIAIASDAPVDITGLRWSAVVYDVDGAVLESSTGQVPSVHPLDVVEAGTIAMTMPADGSPVLVHVRLDDAERLLTERIQILGASGTAAPLAGLLPDGRQPGPDEIRDAGIHPANADNLAASANGGRIVAISGAEARNTDPSLALIDGAFASEPDRFAGVGAWRSTTEEGWVELELARSAKVSRICIGRDRSGSEFDRIVDRVAIEASLDGEDWVPIAEFDGLAPLLGDRLGGHEPGPRDQYRPIWTLDMRVPSVAARFIRLTVRGRAGNPRFVALDEIEVYEDAAVRVAAPEALVRDHREQPRSLRRAALEAEWVGASEARRGLEVRTVRVRNTSDAIALYCDVVSADGYRPRTLVEGGGVSIPPREFRDLVVVTDPHQSESSATPWQVVAWNSDPARII